VKALGDSELSVRCSASYAVGRIGTRAGDAIPLLEQNLRGRDAFLQMQRLALVHVNPKRRDLADLCLRSR